MGWIAAATVAWIGVDVVSAWNALCTAVLGRASRVLSLLE
jgi:hypothetical protein